MSVAAVGAAVAGVVVSSAMSDGGGGGGADASSQMLAGISKEEWDLYKEQAIPMLRELVGMRSPTTTQEEQALAAGETKAAFSTARQNMQRALTRERNPGDPGYDAIMGDTYMDEAGAVSRAVTDARRAVSDRDWGRTLQAIGAYQRLPQDAAANLGTAGRLSALADQGRRESAGQTAYGALTLAANARKWFGGRDPAGGGTPGQGIDTTGHNVGYDDGYSDYVTQSQYADSLGDFNFADGGKVKGPGTGTSDSVPAVVDGRRPVRLSNGEYIVSADVVRAKGVEFFDKLQQKYHKPVAQRDEQGMADGGAVRRRGLPAEVEDAIFVSLPRRAVSRPRS